MTKQGKTEVHKGWNVNYKYVLTVGQFHSITFNFAIVTI